MRAVIYTRVSTNEQIDGYSLDAQQEQCTRFCESRGWQVVRVYQDAGRSGLSIHRPALQEMLKATDYDVIVCHKLDRFSRSLLDVMSQLAALNERGVTFASASEQFDFSTPFGKVILAMLAAFAQWYVDNLATEIRKGKQERARQGGWNGTLCFGYTTLKYMREQLASAKLTESEADMLERALLQYDHLEDSDALPCPLTASGVQRAFELYAGGFVSYLQIADDLNARGYKMRSGNELNEHTIRDILSNRFYLGETHYTGGRGGRGSKANRQWIPGNHEALIAHDLFEQVEQARSRRVRSRGKEAFKHRHTVYPLAGLIVDSCGVSWRGHTLRGTRYYRQRDERGIKRTCQPVRKAIKAQELEQQIEQLLSQLKVPANWMEVPLQPVLPDKAKLRAKLDRAKRLYIEGDISEIEYQQVKAEVVAQLDTPEQAVSNAELIRLYSMIQNIEAVWRMANEKERYDIARALFEKVVITDRVVAVHSTITLSALLFAGTDVPPSGKDRIRTCGTTYGHATA